MKQIKNLQATNPIKTISLFSGAGGLDIGAILAGAQIVWANDIMKDACLSYSMNIGNHISCGDINSYLSDLSQYEGVDLVIGGPPCQGFSVAGKMDESDERSQLIWSYYKVIQTVLPKAFIMENVKALGTLKRWASVRDELIYKLQNLGYSVGFCILNASDFDVPQARERIFIVGFKDSSSAQIDLDTMIQSYRNKAKTIRDTLKILDKAGTGNNTMVCNAKITIASNPILRKSPYAGMIFNGLGRPLKIDGYSATLPASMGGNKTPIIDEDALYKEAKPWVEIYHEYLTKDISIAKKQVTPSSLRRITVDEARLIQTFPMEYIFCGSQSSQYTQIGNAVPCNLAKAVCRMVIDILQGRKQVQYEYLLNQSIWHQ